MKAAEVARIRLRHLGLSSSSHDKPVDVVRHHLAMQSQDFGPAKWSIAQRLGKVVDADVERKVSDGSILRTHVMRPTWHFVARDDLRWLMALTGPRVRKGLQRRYRELGLDPKTLARGERLIANNLRGAKHLTRREIGEILRRARVDSEGQRLPHLLMHCELEAIICSGRVRGKDQTYALFDERVPRGRRFDRDTAIVELVRRYLQGHGPATLKDMSWWSGLTITDLRAGVIGLGADAISESVQGLTLWRLDNQAPRARARSGVHLLQAYDEFVVGYTESRYLGDPNGERLRSSFREFRLPTGTVLADSRIIGHWRRSTEGTKVDIEVMLYNRLRGPDAKALQSASADLGTFLTKEPRLRTEVL